MRKIFLAGISALFLAGLAQAQDQLRYNYKKNNYIYTGAERQHVAGTTPMDIKLGRVSFPDGADIYILRIDFEDTTPWKMPKNASLTINTTAGRKILLSNDGDSPNLVAPSGIETSAGKVYWNYGEYYMEKADAEKILAGVESIEARRRSSETGLISVQYKNNEFGAAFKKAWDAIAAAPKPSGELGSQLRSISDQRGNRLVETNTVQVNGRLSISLVYLYYAESNSESYDLNLYIPATTVPIGGKVIIRTSSGEAIELAQEKELAAGRIICYPTVDQIKKMAHGVTSVTVHPVGNPVSIQIADDSFAKSLDLLYNSLQTVSIL